MAELATAFVLLVAGGCARAVAQPLWSRFVHWWHTEGNEPPEFKFMDRWVWWLAGSSGENSLLQQLDIARDKRDAFATRCEEIVARLKEPSTWQEQYTGTKNARKVPVYGNEWHHKELERARQKLSKEEFARLERGLGRAKAWRRRGDDQ